MANEKFKVKFGLAVGDTQATIDGGNGNIVTNGDIDVKGGNITNTTGALDIATTGGTNLSFSPASPGQTVVNSQLDVNGNIVGDLLQIDNIQIDGNTVSATSGALTLSTTSGSNNVVIDPSSGTTVNDGHMILGQLNTDAILTTNGTGDLDIRTGSWPTSANITLADGVNGNITVDTDGTGQVIINAKTDVDELQVDNININGNTISSTDAFTSTGSTISNGSGLAGTILTIGTLTSGTIGVGQTIAGGTTLGNTTIIANISGSGSGSTWTVSPSQLVASSSIDGGGNISLTPSSVGVTQANTRFSALGGSSLGDTVAIGGATVNSSGLYPVIQSTTQAQISPSLFIDNTDAGRSGSIILRDYGQNRPSGLSTTAAVPTIAIEGKRGTATSTGAGTQTAANAVLGIYQFGGFNGTNFMSSSGTGGNPLNFIGQAVEDFVADTASFTGYTSGTTLTVTSGTNVHPGLALSATGILDGTVISAYGTGTGGTGTYTISRSQTLFSIGTPGSFTGAGTKNAGSRLLVQYQPQGVKFNAVAGTSASRQIGFAISQIAASTQTVAGITIPLSPAPTITLGDSGTAADNILTSSDGNTLYNRIGLGNVNFVNGAMVVSGVTGNDTATVTASIGTTTMTVTAVSSGILSVGSQVYGTGVSQLTRITAQLTSATAALATTTATGTISTPTITVASATGIAVGQLVIATGVPNDTLVINVVGTTVTLSRNLTAGLSATAINFYTAGSTGTYTVTPSQTVASTTMVTGPDNYQLLGSNALNINGARQSGVPGRRQPIKNDDIISQLNFRGVNTRDATGFNLNVNTGARLTARATEDFSTARAGSRFIIETPANGGTALTERINTSTDGTTFRSDSYTFLNAAGTQVTSAAINYTRTYGEVAYTNAAGFAIAAQNTIYTMPLDTTLNASGVTIANTGDININVAGWYKIIMSLQITLTGSGSAPGQIDFWLRKNGSDVANSKTQVDLLKDQKAVIAMDWLVNSDGNDYWEIVYVGTTANYADIDFPTVAATTTPYVSPVAPALIVNVIPAGA